MEAASAAAAQSRFPQFSHWLPHSLAQGNAGLCLLWAYLDTSFPGEGWDRVGKDHLEVAARGAEQTPWAGTGLASGIVGLAFAAWQLSRGGARYQRLLASLDPVIARDTIQIAMRIRESNGIGVGEFDIISGLSGIGAYLLARYPTPAATAALGHTVDALTALVGGDELPPRWHTPVHLLFDEETRKSYPYGNLNCGLAHGVPGMLAFLSLFRLADVRLPEVSLEDVDCRIVAMADWLAANRCDDHWGVNWPAAVHLQPSEEASGDGQLRCGDPVHAPGGPSRAAWCYGAPGVARALWLAGEALGRSGYNELAVSAMQAVFRRPIPARMIDSPTFCHGVAGLLAIAQRFATDTQSPLFQEECEKLTRQVLDSFQPDSMLGFRNLEYSNHPTDQPGLLDGAAGVAIVLATVATGVEPAWDRAFLLA